MYSWEAAGVGLPHSAAGQYDATARVPLSQLQPGDLVFYGSPPHHVGIYVGGGQMINALHSGTNVEYDSIYMEGDLIGGGPVHSTAQPWAHLAPHRSSASGGGSCPPATSRLPPSPARSWARPFG